MLKNVFLLSAAAAALCACSSTPDVTYQYYPAKSVTVLSVTQNLACTKAVKHGEPPKLVVTSVLQTPTTTYSADYGQGPYRLRLRDLDSTLADTDTMFTLSDDGRLKTINATTTGQGETILKSAITLGTAVVAFAGAEFAAQQNIDTEIFKREAEQRRKAKPKPTPCQILANWPAGDKGVSLIFTTVVDLNRLPANRPVYLNRPGAAVVPAAEATPEPTTSVSDPQLYKAMTATGPVLPRVSMKVAGKTPLQRAADYVPDTSERVGEVTLQDAQAVRMDFWVDDNWAASNVATIPVAGSNYLLPVPKATAFGNSKIGLTLSDSGTVTSIEYGKNTGAAGPMNVVSSAVTAATPAPPPVGP